MRQSRRLARGFTLVELLAVIAIIAVLVSILVPYLGRAKELANRARCQANTKVLAQAAVAYCDTWKCLAPLGWGPNYNSDGPVYNYTVLYRWYERPMLGQYFGEDVPSGGVVDGWSPPKKSVLRCPTRSPNTYRSSGVDIPIGDNTWIAYNSNMAYDCEPLRSGHRCYWRGPRLDEVLVGGHRLVLFADGKGGGVYYIGNWQGTDPTSPGADVSNSGSTTDPRHNGGTNFGFLDGHVTYYADATSAHFAKFVLVSAGGEGK